MLCRWTIYPFFKLYFTLGPDCIAQAYSPGHVLSTVRTEFDRNVCACTEVGRAQPISLILSDCMLAVLCLRYASPTSVESAVCIIQHIIHLKYIYFFIFSLFSAMFLFITVFWLWLIYTLC